MITHVRNLILALMMTALTSGTAVASVTPVRVTDYTGTVDGIAVGVEASGRIHVLWTGERSTDSTFTAFYSTSLDGLSWSPYQVLDTGDAFDPQIVVDDTHNLVHIVYRSNTNGIIHRTSSGGILSAPTVVDITGVFRPALAVNPATGYAYLTWRKWEDATYTTVNDMYAWWNGEVWSAPTEPINDGEWSSIAVSPAGAVMLAGVLTDGMGTYIVARSALADDGVNFDSPVQTSLGYSWPEADSSAEVVYNYADNTFHLLGEHLVWPGSSEFYHWVWNGTSWSGPDNLSQTVDTWSGQHAYGGSVPGLDTLFVSWSEGSDPSLIMTCTWSASGMTPAVDISHYLTDAGIIRNRTSWCLAADASPYLAIGEATNQYLGVYLLVLPSVKGIFADDFEENSTDAWSLTVP